FGLLRPVGFVGQQRRAIHQYGAGMGVAATQPVEDGEAVGVDVPPINQAFAGEPGQPVQSWYGVAAAEDDDGSFGWREREVGDLVLDDEYCGAVWRCVGELGNLHGHFGVAAAI